MTMDKKARLDWLASECGKEEFHIQELKAELVRRQARHDTMWAESERLVKELEGEKKEGSKQ